jgi:hypothetical protein
MPSLAGGECSTGVIVLSRQGLLSCGLWQLQLLLLLMVYYLTYTVNRQHFNQTFPEESGYSKTHAVTLITPPPLQRHKCFCLSLFMATPRTMKEIVLSKYVSTNEDLPSTPKLALLFRFLFIFLRNIPDLTCHATALTCMPQQYLDLPCRSYLTCHAAAT